VKSLGSDLQTEISDGASMFSVGEKQLICLARVILRKSKILVLDEATANVHFETDVFIQKKIDEIFEQSTVFTIAHRLSTIASYDKVLVMDKGELREFDHPYKLLVKSIGDLEITNPNGFFAHMVINTGPSNASQIFDTAGVFQEKGNLNIYYLF